MGVGGAGFVYGLLECQGLALKVSYMLADAGVSCGHECIVEIPPDGGGERQGGERPEGGGCGEVVGLHGAAHGHLDCVLARLELSCLCHGHVAAFNCERKRLCS